MRWNFFVVLVLIAPLQSVMAQQKITEPGEYSLLNGPGVPTRFQPHGDATWFDDRLELGPKGSAQAPVEVWPLAKLTADIQLTRAEKGKPASYAVEFRFLLSQRVSAVVQEIEENGKPVLQLRIEHFQPPAFFGRGTTIVVREKTFPPAQLAGPLTFDFRYGLLTVVRGDTELLVGFADTLPLNLEAVVVTSTAKVTIASGALQIHAKGRLPKPTKVQERALQTAMNAWMLKGSSGATYEAISLGEEALKVYREINGGEDDMGTSDSLQNIGAMYLLFGEGHRGRAALEQSLAIRQELLGPHHPKVADAHESLATFLDREVADRTQAIAHWQAAIAVYKHLGRSNADLAHALEQLAENFRELHDIGAARSAMEEALKIREQHDDSWDAKNALLRLRLELARLERAAGQIEASDAHYQAVQKVLQTELAQAKPLERWRILPTLSKVHRVLGNAKEANALLAEAESASYPPGQKAMYHTTMLMYYDQHQDAGKEASHAKELESVLLAEATARKGPQPLFLQSKEQYEFGRLKLVQGDTAAAVPYYQKALAIDLRRANELLDVLSEAEAMRHVGEAWYQRNGFLAGLRSLPERDARAAYDALWQTRGLASRAILGRRLTRVDDPQVMAARRDLIRTRQQLAAMASQRFPSHATFQKLTREKEERERALTALSRDFRSLQSSAAITVDDIAAQLPEGVGIVDFVQLPAAPTWHKADETYVYDAFVIRKNKDTKADITWIPLGPAEPIDKAVGDWLTKMLALDKQAEQPAAARVVRDAIWKPIAPHLGDCQTVIVIPDQQLCNVPWGALPGERKKSFLIETHAIATAQHGHQLHALLTTPPPAGDATLLVGDLHYGAPTKPSDLAQRTAAVDLDWERIEHSRAELDEIAALLPQPKLITGAEATEAALREALPKYQHIHLSTHGFFGTPGVRADVKLTSAERLQLSRNPLLRSGLVLSRANALRHRDPTLAATRGDGLLLAEELAEIDLAGADLVVLSACSTYLGDTVAGEGVMGLAHTLNAAGARSVVASLWDVDDPATRALMVLFYRELHASQPRSGKLAALRAAQLKMIRGYDPVAGGIRGIGGTRPIDVIKLKPGEPLPPYYWAAFTLSGDWR